jgi:hypothetical protein
MNKELVLTSLARHTFSWVINKVGLLSVLIVMAMVALHPTLEAQNDLACINHINFSLDPTTCTGSVTPEMALVGNEMCAEGFEIIITDDFNRPVANLFTIDDVGRTFTYMICCEDNCCWGTVSVEFKAAISVACPPDDTIPCATLDFHNFFEPVNTGCGSIEVELLSQEKTHLSCDEALTATVTRTYLVTDNFGNSKQCQQNVALARLDPTEIIWPDNSTLSCSDTTLVFDNEGLPLPWYFQGFGTGSGTGSGTGFGLNNGLPIICGVSASRDYLFGNNNNVAQLSGNDPVSGEHLFCPDGSGRGAFPLVPEGGAVFIFETGDPNNPTVESTFFKGNDTPVFCNTQLTYTDIIFPSVNGNCKRQIIRNWELSEWWCTSELVTSSIQYIDIIDDVAPEFTCPEDIVVTNNEACTGSVLLPLINPTDLCGDEIIVSSQTPLGIVEGDGAPAELNFGKNVINVTVSDECYNRSTCSYTITVQDQTEPVAICDQTKVVSLTTLSENKVPASVFDNGSFDECGIERMEVRRMDTQCDSLALDWDSYVEFCCADADGEETMVAFRVVDKGGNQSVCMVTVEVQNKLTPSLACPADVTVDCSQGYDINNLGLTFGVPSIGGACANIQIPEELVQSNVNLCGIGTLERTFKFTDAQGNTLESCTQNITIENAAPITANSITWPLDYEENSGCAGLGLLAPELLPDGFGFPTVFGSDGCNQLGFDFVDKVINNGPSASSCVFIERTWTAVNWCSTIGNEFEVFVIPQPQILRLRNTIAPVISPSGPITIDSHNSDCQSGEVLIVRSATDDCISSLVWSYTVRDRNGLVVATGSSSTLSASFPVGNYEVEWIVRDGCGNQDTDIQVLAVFDDTPPTPVCHNGLSAALVGDDTDGDGQIDFDSVELWASDFDAGSYPNCNNPITFSFSPDTTDKVRIYDCTNRGLNEVRLYVTDVFTGAQDFCTGLIDIQGGSTCLNGNILFVAGEVMTETSQTIEGVNVRLEADAGVDITDADGTYAFLDMPVGGDYQVIPQYENDYLNGVSTIDIIMIQRHILGIESLDSPYKLIAADIDNSEQINGIDLVELRKLVLGIYDELPQNESWRFISADHTFAQPTNPWLGQLPEWYSIIGFSDNLYLDFIGVKIGDVSNDVIANLDTKETPAHSALNFSTPPHSIGAGEVKTIPVTAANYSDIRGWQTTMAYDADEIEILSVNGDAIDIRDEHIYTGKSGFLTFSYDGASQSIATDEVLFEIQVLAKTAINSSRLFELNSEITKSEAYDKDFNRLALDMQSSEIESAEILSLYPNPFVKEAQLQFSLPNAGLVRFEFYDMDGKVLDVQEGTFDSGINQLQIQRERLQTTGVVYIRMATDRDITEYRMIVL